MNVTPVDEMWDMPSNPEEAERQLAALIRRADREGMAVSIAGARHTMGGHSIARDGIVVNTLPFRAMELDEGRNVLHVQAGALWSDVVPYLNARGRSVAVMQSNNSFSVGGSISVNCHGWQAGRAPIASTVRSFRLLKPDGAIVRCSRTENAELFALVLGGYGLFGVILDAELEVMPNEEYRLERFVIPVASYVPAFEREVRWKSEATMAYGRLSVAPDSFLDEAILNVFRRVPAGSGRASRTEFPEVAGLTRAVFRGQVGSDYGKTLRWQAERRLAGVLSAGAIHRNQLLGEPAAVFANRSAASTDILHEYFVPPSCLRRFRRPASVDRQEARRRPPQRDRERRAPRRRHLPALRRPGHARCRDAVQPAAHGAGDAAMEAMTRDMVDAALGLGGRFYLPYRLHATQEQLLAAYPQVPRFLALKRRYDPRLIFRNTFYTKYSTLEAGPS
jgi:FAD/FMN-containing dehydrogenase